MKQLERDEFNFNSKLLKEGKIKELNEKPGFFVNYEMPGDGCQSDHYPTLELAKTAANGFKQRIEGNAYAEREHYPTISKDFIVIPLDSETRYKQSHKSDVILDYYY